MRCFLGVFFREKEGKGKIVRRSEGGGTFFKHELFIR